MDLWLLSLPKVWTPKPIAAWLRQSAVRFSIKLPWLLVLLTSLVCEDGLVLWVLIVEMLLRIHRPSESSSSRVEDVVRSSLTSLRSLWYSESFFMEFRREDVSLSMLLVMLLIVSRIESGRSIAIWDRWSLGRKQSSPVESVLAWKIKWKILNDENIDIILQIYWVLMAVL